MYFLIILIFLYFGFGFVINLGRGLFLGLVKIIMTLMQKVRSFFKDMILKLKELKSDVLFKIRGYEKIEEPDYDFEKMRKNLKL